MGRCSNSRKSPRDTVESRQITPESQREEKASLFYALESRGPHFVLLFAGACLASGVYAVLIAAWPFAAVETVWSLVAVRRWRREISSGSVRSS